MRNVLILISFEMQSKRLTVHQAAVKVVKKIQKTIFCTLNLLICTLWIRLRILRTAYTDLSVFCLRSPLGRNRIRAHTQVTSQEKNSNKLQLTFYKLRSRTMGASVAKAFRFLLALDPTINGFQRY